jgi:hypothetical protein
LQWIIVVAVVLALLLIACAIIFLLVFRRRMNDNDEQLRDGDEHSTPLSTEAPSSAFDLPSPPLDDDDDDEISDLGGYPSGVAGAPCKLIECQTITIIDDDATVVDATESLGAETGELGRVRGATADETMEFGRPSKPDLNDDASNSLSE